LSLLSGVAVSKYRVPDNATDGSHFTSGCQSGLNVNQAQTSLSEAMGPLILPTLWAGRAIEMSKRRIAQGPQRPIKCHFHELGNGSLLA
jgi:hypothetical protein